MLIGSSSNTGDAVFFQKLFAINSEFEERNRKKLERIDYGGNVTGVIIFPISIYDEYEENLKTYNGYKFLDRFKNFDNKTEYCLNVNILISPLDVKRLSVEELKQLYCDLIVKTIENFDFKMPKNFDFLSFKRDFFNIVDDFRKIKVENTL